MLHNEANNLQPETNADAGHVESLARSLLGIAQIRFLFSDLLGRSRNSSAEDAYRHRSQELTPGKYREFSLPLARRAIAGLVALSLLCCLLLRC